MNIQDTWDASNVLVGVLTLVYRSGVDFDAR